MASSYDAYDSRPRSSRRNESFSKSRDRYYLKPTAGPHFTSSSGEGRGRGGVNGDGQSDNEYASKRSSRPSLDPRYHYPPPLPPDTGRTPHYPPSPNRRQYSWPPQPTCEDEAAALAKEAGTQSLLKTVGKDEARSRGTIDQEPIVQDVPELVNREERRFVPVTDNARQQATSPPVITPPTSEDERERKAKRRPSKLDMSFNKFDDSVPEMSKRAASPYAFKPSRQPKDEPSADAFLSPEDMLSPPPTDSRSRRRVHVGAHSQPSSPSRRDSKQSSDYFSLLADETAVDDTDDDRSDLSSRSDRPKPSMYPPAVSRKSGNLRTSTQPSVIDFAPPPNAASIRRLNLDTRRNTDTVNTLPTLSNFRVDQSRRLTPLMASGALSALGTLAVSSSPTTPKSAAELPLPITRSRESSYGSSYAVSPADVPRKQEPPTPQRSPRVSADLSRDQSTISSPASRTGSVSGSRPSSPSPRTPGDSPRLPKTDLDWSALITANAARRTKPPSRLNSSVWQESMPAMPSMPTMPTMHRVDLRPSGPTRNSSLPYPVNDGPATPTAYMPSERTHQYFPETRPLVQTSAKEPAQYIPDKRSRLQAPDAQQSKTASRSPSPAPSSKSYTSTASSSKTVRPSIQTHHSTSAVPRHEKLQQAEKSGSTQGRRGSYTLSSQAKSDLQVLVKKGLPHCPRARPVAGYDDWYTLIGAPSLDFCPDCIDKIFERTIFRNYFRRSPPLPLNAPVQCAMGGFAWIRLAWLYTLQQQRTDLDLLKDVAKIEDSSDPPCPGDREVVRPWYGLRDPDGLFVKNFHVCYSDVRKVERMLPTLEGLFLPLPQRVSYTKATCAIRPDSNRFSAYIDALIATHEKAVASRKPANSLPFIDLVERRQSLRDCTKDHLLLGQLWHFIPSIPQLTVCEDCFETIIEPEVKKNQDIAVRFNRTIQPLYGEGPGSSCQLYSQRMRKVFRRALQDNDIKYLTRKAKERRDAELRLQERYRYVVNKAKRLSWEGSGSEDDERRLDREITRITDEWRTYWE